MLIKTFRIEPRQNQKLDEIATNEKLDSLSETVRFLIENYKKKSDAPKVTEQKPATIQMANDPEVKKDIKKILKISAILGRSIDARALGEVDRILEGEDEPL